MRGVHEGLVAVMVVALAGCPPPAGGATATDTTTTTSTTSSSSTTGAEPTSGAPTTGATTSTSVTTGPQPDVGGASVCAHDSPAALMNCVDPARYAEDLEFVAAVRTPGSIHWQAVQERCAAALEEAGFATELHDYGSGVNVIGTLPGTTTPDEVVLLAAHYDHISGCPGADDNASGVAGALEVARALGGAALPRTVVVACWDEEESGLRGSRAYADAITGTQVVVAINFDMIGFASAAPNSQIFPEPLAERFPGLARELEAHERRADFIAVVADAPAEVFALDLEAHAESLGRLTGVMTLTAQEKLDEDAFGLLAMSDHRSFWERDIPALHVFDTGVFRNPAYHCSLGLDTVETLDVGFTTDVMKATAAAVATAAGL